MNTRCSRCGHKLIERVAGRVWVTCRCGTVNVLEGPAPAVPLYALAMEKTAGAKLQAVLSS